MLNITKELDKLGKTINDDAKKFSKVRSGKLKNSHTYKVVVDKLVFEQVEYGDYQKVDPLEKAINKNIDKGISDITDSLINKIV